MNESTRNGRDSRVFDRTFFADHLPGMLAAEADAQGGKEPQVVVVLKHDLAFKVESGVEPRDGFVTFVTKERDMLRRIAIPYSAILAVTMGRDESAKAKPGFLSQ